jgi:hypothetical protein
MQFGDEEEVGEQPTAPAPVLVTRPTFGRTPSKASTPAPVFHPLAYRGVVAEWSVEWRERWGRRANTLEEQGLSWRDAETQAFVELWKELRQLNSPNVEATQAPSTALAEAEPAARQDD